MCTRPWYNAARLGNLKGTSGGFGEIYVWVGEYVLGIPAVLPIRRRMRLNQHHMTVQSLAHAILVIYTSALLAL